MVAVKFKHQTPFLEYSNRLNDLGVSILVQMVHKDFFAVR